MKRWFRTFFVGGLIAYRGLFNWIRPAMYIPTMLGSPLFQLIFFTKRLRQSGDRFAAGWGMPGLKSGLTSGQRQSDRLAG